MNALFHEVEAVDTELHLGMGVVLAIFFGITLVSAVFFGLGYSFGRTGTAAPAANSLPSTSAQPSSQNAMSVLRSTVAPTPKASHSAATTASVQHPPALVRASVISKTPAAPSSSNRAAAPTQSSSYMVQISAVAGRKDAQALASALQKHGLSARIHTKTHDKFFHVQIGPFATQQKAESMRHKVIAAGYKAILKPTT